jgi:hypothetical protein
VVANGKMDRDPRDDPTCDSQEAIDMINARDN